jgi:hypothetical protein
MTISMFQASVPVFVRALNNLAGILEKGVAHAKACKIEETVLLNSRLFPDMFPLARQVQIATDTARSGAARHRLMVARTRRFHGRAAVARSRCKGSHTCSTTCYPTSIFM